MQGLRVSGSVGLRAYRLGRWIAPAPARPRRLAERVERVLVTVLETAPQAQGYRAAQWTTPLLCHNVREQQTLAVSEVTVRRCLYRLGYRWQRPRYILARRSRYWRQAKGGSSAA
jgi:transposase